MTDSRPEPARALRSGVTRWSRGSLVLASAAIAVSIAGCAGGGGVPAVSAIEPLARRAPYVPDGVDRALHDAASASLRADRDGAERAASRIGAVDAERAARDERTTALAALARDAGIATLRGPAKQRTAARDLLATSDVDRATRARLEQDVADDPLVLAEERTHDAWLVSLGSKFNALAEPAGRSVTSPIFAATGLLRALLGLAVQGHLDDELSVPERQALAQWKRFASEEPGAPERAQIEARIDEAQAAWNRTQRDRKLRDARTHLRNGRSGAALLSSSRALSFVPEDRTATALRDESAGRLLRVKRARARTLAATTELADPGRPEARALSVALLSGRPGAVADAAHALAVATADDDRPNEIALHDAARFAEASLALHEGRERDSWQTLDEIAGRGDASPLARHARTLLASAASNPFEAFDAARSNDRRRSLGWLFLGPLAGGARERDLPRPVEWMIEVPTTLDVVLGLPNRLIQYPWLNDRSKGTSAAAHARRYLARFPHGERAGEVRDWLIAFERARGNPAGALALVAGAEVAGVDVAALREDAARQLLEGAKRETRRDARMAYLRRVAADHPSTEAGREAGEQVREQMRTATPQRVRLSKQFLQENRTIAGVDGLGLRAEMIDGDLRNGELHPDGVVLAGGRVLEFSFVDVSGDEDDPPATRRERVSEERLARIVSLLEETTRRRALVDPDDSLAPDADRDRFFEQARLGVTDRPDLRATAESDHAFLGQRERFGLVRGRESILPVDLVIQGSFPELGLGAFPRVRMPKSTADAVLYR